MIERSCKPITPCNVQLGAPNNPPMNIFVPFTVVSSHTLQAMMWYLHHVVFVDVSGDNWDYVRYFEQRWAERKTFVSVEHDVQPAPGVLREMALCREHWCVEDYWGPPEAKGVAPTFGVVKFSAHFIETVSDVWKDYRNGRHETFVNSLVVPRDAQVGQAWRFLDVYMYEYLQEKHPGVFAAHHHWPAAVHADEGAFYPPIQVSTPDGRVLKEHPLMSKTIELTFNTL